MRNLKLIILLLISISASALDTKEVASLDRWAEGQQAALFKDCPKLFRADWLKQYEKVRIEYIQKLEEIGDQAIKDRLKSPVFWNLGKVVYPQDLPESYPLKGAFLACYDHFDAYQEARNNVEAMKAMKKLEACEKVNYREDAPAVLGSYLGCLKQIKY